MPGIPVFRAMQIIVLASDDQKEELRADEISQNPSLVFVNHPGEFRSFPGADAFIDLLFEFSVERIQLLQSLLPRTVIINSVEYCLTDTDPSFVRINGWNSFLSSALIESSSHEKNRTAVEFIFSLFNKKLEWLDDQPGFITSRVVSMIINEAYLALEEGVSSRKEIDTAMKLGTNYPFGPFEWAEKIGTQRICSLLYRLSKQNARYLPAPLLVKESGISFQ